MVDDRRPAIQYRFYRWGGNVTLKVKMICVMREPAVCWRAIVVLLFKRLILFAVSFGDVHHNSIRQHACGDMDQMMRGFWGGPCERSEWIGDALWLLGGGSYGMGW